MLKRTFALVALASLASEIAAQPLGAGAARPEVAANVQAEAQQARAQAPAARAAEEAVEGEQAAAPKKKGFQAAPYFGFSIGPRTTYTGAPAVNKGFAGIASAGVATMFNECIYFGGELFIYDNLNIKNYTNGNANVKSSWTYGLDLMPGYLITQNVLGYLRIGAASTEYRNHVNDGIMAWRFGLGAQTNICGGWDIRTEYVYNNYRRRSPIGKPQTDQFNLGVLYKFL